MPQSVAQISNDIIHHHIGTKLGQLLHDLTMQQSNAASFTKPGKGNEKQQKYKGFDGQLYTLQDTPNFALITE